MGDEEHKEQWSEIEDEIEEKEQQEDPVLKGEIHLETKSLK